jgi:hypothetical protein
MTWWPGLLVLATAVVAGLVWAVRLRRSAAPAARPTLDLSSPPTWRVEQAALARRKDELVATLRTMPEGDTVERQRLEAEAVGAMKRLDELAALEAGPSTETIAPPRRGSFLAGFLTGAVSAGVVAFLLVSASDEWDRGRVDPNAARPDAARPDAARPGAAPMAGAADHPQVSPAASAEIERLRAAVAANPEDLAARRQLAITFLTSNQLFEAFQEAQAVLAKAPEDFDARMVVGIVRLAMGSADEAATHFDTAIAQHPADPSGYIYRGLVEERRGHLDEAVQIWRRGLLAAGGSHPDLEKLIADAGNPAPVPAAPSAAPSPNDVAGSTPPVADPAGPAAGGGFRVRIELADATPSRGVLFLALRAGPAGPPALVKRIEGPVFPLELELTATDAMIPGSPLPEAGELTVRLDVDGNASTKGSDEPQATVAARRGETTRVVLGGS